MTVEQSVNSCKQKWQRREVEMNGFMLPYAKPIIIVSNWMKNGFMAFRAKLIDVMVTNIPLMKE